MRSLRAEGLRGFLILLFCQLSLEHQAGDGFNPSASSTYHLFHQKFSDPSGGVTDMVEAKALAQDVIRIGPFTAVHRFASSSPEGASAFRGSDGVIGLSYSTLPDSASILQTLFHHKRNSWDVQQPSSFKEVKPKMFTIVMTDRTGELQLGGYDSSSVSGGLAYLPLAPGDGYSVNLLKIAYGDSTIIDGQDTAASGSGGLSLKASFDTGSTCIMLPDTTKGAEAGSPFRRLLDAHMRYGRQELRFELGSEDGSRFTLHVPYEDWTHPNGCLGPYAGDKVVFGNPVFRRYVVVHKLESQPFSLGLGLRDPTYQTISQLSSLPVALDIQNRENGVSKVGLQVDGSGAERRYLLPVTLGTPAQQLDLVVDTGSYLTEIFTCHPCGMEVRSNKKNHDHHSSKLNHQDKVVHKQKSEHKEEKQHKSHKEHLQHERREAAKQRLAEKAGKHHQSLHSSPDTSDFQTSGILVVAALIAVVWISEMRRKQKEKDHRFKLVEYKSVEGEPSQFEFSDL